MLQLLHTVVHLKKMSITHNVTPTLQQRTRPPTISIPQGNHRVIGVMIFDADILPEHYKNAADAAKDELENAIISKAIEGANFWNSVLKIVNSKEGGKNGS